MGYNDREGVGVVRWMDAGEEWARWGGWMLERSG